MWGGDGVIKITTMSNTSYWVLHVITAYGHVVVRLDGRNHLVTGIDVWYGSTTVSVTYTYYAATSTSTDYAVLTVTPNVSNIKVILLACFPDRASGDNCIFGVTNTPF